MKGLIELRKHYPSFRMTTAEDIRNNLTFLEGQTNVVAFTLKEATQGGPNKQLAIIHNANKEDIEVTLPSHGPWKVLVNGEQAGIEEI